MDAPRPTRLAKAPMPHAWDDVRDSLHLHGGDAMIPHPGAAQATGSPAGPAASRILIADGEPKIRSLIGGALAAAGTRPTWRAPGRRGLRRALECHYDLIILDLGDAGPGRPGRSGAHAEARARARR